MKRLNENQWNECILLFKNNIECKEICERYAINVTTLWRRINKDKIKRYSIEEVLEITEEIKNQKKENFILYKKINTLQEQIKEK